jgi:hypothetical protein
MSLLDIFMEMEKRILLGETILDTLKKKSVNKPIRACWKRSMTEELSRGKDNLTERK